MAIPAHLTSMEDQFLGITCPLYFFISAASISKYTSKVRWCRNRSENRGSSLRIFVQASLRDEWHPQFSRSRLWSSSIGRRIHDTRAGSDFAISTPTKLFTQSSSISQRSASASIHLPLPYFLACTIPCEVLHATDANFQAPPQELHHRIPDSEPIGLPALAGSLVSKPVPVCRLARRTAPEAEFAQMGNGHSVMKIPLLGRSKNSHSPPPLELR